MGHRPIQADEKTRLRLSHDCEGVANVKHGAIGSGMLIGFPRCWLAVGFSTEWYRSAGNAVSRLARRDAATACIRASYTLTSLHAAHVLRAPRAPPDVRTEPRPRYGQA